MARPSPDTYLARTSADGDAVRSAVDALRGLTADERLAALDEWMEEILTVLGGAAPAADTGHPFWRHWRDPSLGRPA